MADWHSERFQQKPGRVATTCAECGVPMWLPASKLSMYQRCGTACNAAFHERRRNERSRDCETCGKQFAPRPVQISKGQGRYCSQACNRAFTESGQTPEARAAGVVAMRAKRERGEWTVKCGEANHRWKGGPEATRRRLLESGIQAQRVRDYRRRNPDKVREFNKNRSQRKTGKLPYGTVPAIRLRQKDRCAICRARLCGKGHLDHIMPLALGGQHLPSNLQFLCAPCNLTKSAKHPIAYMQERGMLL